MAASPADATQPVGQGLGRGEVGLRRARERACRAIPAAALTVVAAILKANAAAAAAEMRAHIEFVREAYASYQGD